MEVVILSASDVARSYACLGSSRVKAILPLQPIRSKLIFVYN